MHVNIGEAKTRLSELVAAAVRGEVVVIAKDGKPQAKLVPVESAAEEERQRAIAKRRAAFGKFAKEFEGLDVTPEWIREQREYSEERRKLYGIDD